MQFWNNLKKAGAKANHCTAVVPCIDPKCAVCQCGGRCGATTCTGVVKATHTHCGKCGVPNPNFDPQAK